MRFAPINCHEDGSWRFTSEMRRGSKRRNYILERVISSINLDWQINRMHRFRKRAIVDRLSK